MKNYIVSGENCDYGFVTVGVEANTPEDAIEAAMDRLEEEGIFQLTEVHVREEGN